MLEHRKRERLVAALRIAATAYVAAVHFGPSAEVGRCVSRMRQRGKLRGSVNVIPGDDKADIIYNSIDLTPSFGVLKPVVQVSVR
jgi:hypothetical protein